MSDQALKSCFAPVADARTRVLVLGSLPGEASLAAGRYYANPRNQFWRLMAAVMDRPLESLGYEERLATLLEVGVGLWDTVASATRSGSLDAAIRLHEASDLNSLARQLPALAAVAFNGLKSASIGTKVLSGNDHALLTLPSSSPALTMPFEQKLSQWTKLRAFL